MQQEEFLKEYFDKSATVEVNACELQKLLQDKLTIERKLKIALNKVELVNSLLETKQEDTITVSLDVKC